MYTSSLGEFWDLPGHELLFGNRCVEPEWLDGWGCEELVFAVGIWEVDRVPWVGWLLGNLKSVPRDE